MLTVTAEAHNSLLHLYLPADVAGVAAAAAARMLVCVCIRVCVSLCGTFSLHFLQTAVRWQSHNTWSTRSRAVVGPKKKKKEKKKRKTPVAFWEV